VREREYILKLKSIVKSTKCEKYKSKGKGLNNQQISETLSQVKVKQHYSTFCRHCNQYYPLYLVIFQATFDNIAHNSQ